MQEVQQAGVESRRNRDSPVARREELDEVEAGLSVIDAAVDMSGLHVDQPRRFEGFGHLDDHLHGDPTRIAFVARQESSIAIVKHRRSYHRGGRRFCVREPAMLTDNKVKQTCTSKG